jgi:hypothetical protein
MVVVYVSNLMTKHSDENVFLKIKISYYDNDMNSDVIDINAFLQFV